MAQEKKIIEVERKIPLSIEKIILNFDMSCARVVYERDSYCATPGNVYNQKKVSTMRIVHLPFTLDAPYSITSKNQRMITNAWRCCYSASAAFGKVNEISEDFFCSLTRQHLDHYNAFDPSFSVLIPRLFSENYTIGETTNPINVFRAEGRVYRILNEYYTFEEVE